MLFVDNVHDADTVNERERALQRVVFDFEPEPDFVITESSMLEHAEHALESLKQLPRRRRARKIRDAWHCSGFPLQSSVGRPLCLFFDLGLTWYKRQLGFTHAVNIVPEFYEDEQRRLVHLARKAIPDLVLEIILHDELGNWKSLAV
jgi:hypothetical protein